MPETLNFFCSIIASEHAFSEIMLKWRKVTKFRAVSLTVIIRIKKMTRRGGCLDAKGQVMAQQICWILINRQKPPVKMGIKQRTWAFPFGTAMELVMFYRVNACLAQGRCFVLVPVDIKKNPRPWPAFCSQQVMLERIPQTSVPSRRLLIIIVVKQRTRPISFFYPPAQEMSERIPAK